MKGQTDFHILLSNPFSRKELEVVYTPRPLVWEDKEAAAFIEQRWADHVKEYRDKGMKAFDGSLYRLVGNRMENGKLLLEVGDTRFSEYVGTSLAEFYARFPHAPLASPLAVCITLATSDGIIVVEKRRRVDAYRGRYHVIGGFLERGIDAGSRGLPDPFEGIKREVREEIGVELKDESLVALGLVRNTLIRHPEICFETQLEVTFEALHRIQSSTHVDGEIEELVAVEGSPSGIAQFVAFHHHELVATGEACLLLYGKNHFGQPWFDDTLGLITTGT